MLTLTGNVVWGWKEHFEDLLIPEDMPLQVEAGLDSGGFWPISLVEGARGGRDWPRDAEGNGLSWAVLADMLVQYCVGIWDNAW